MPSISDQTKRKLRQVFWITVAWTIISLFQFMMVYAGVHQLELDVKPSEPFIFLKGSLVAGIVSGIIGGSAMTWLWEGILRSKNYGRALLTIFSTFCISYLLVRIISGLYFYSMELGQPIISAAVFQEVFGGGNFDWPFLVNFTFWLLVVIFTLIALQVNDKYGPGVFRSFLLGKYFQAQREERIFMFLDLRSSTSIAEQLGEEKYFNFLNDVFKHATSGILNSKGEIYQYVGDEIVVSWKIKDGRENANCLQCFFRVQRALLKKNTYYKDVYGIVPTFKAGLHTGFVMAGEIGVVKRDIVYSGDVLNTAARIQSKCNELGVNILVSKYLLDRLSLPPHTFEPHKVGDLLLRGKQNKLSLYTVQA